MRAYLKEQAGKYIPAGILGALGFLILKTSDYLIKPMLPQAYNIIDTKSALMLALLSLVMNFAFLALIIRNLVREKEYKLPEPRLYNGIYFDWLINPLCPVCKAGLQVESLPNQKQIIQKPKLICPNNSKHYNQIPINDIGEEVHIATIRHNLIASNSG